MAQPKSHEDRTIEELQQIKALLQDILIIQAAQAGLKQSQVRKMAGVANIRVTSLWPNIRQRS